MRLHGIVIDSSGIELHLLCQSIGNNAHNIFFVLGCPLPIVFIVFQTDEFIGFPFDKFECSRANRMSSKITISHDKIFSITPSFFCFFLQFFFLARPCFFLCMAVRASGRNLAKILSKFRRDLAEVSPKPRRSLAERFSVAFAGQIFKLNPNIKKSLWM